MIGCGGVDALCWGRAWDMTVLGDVAIHVGLLTQIVVHERHVADLAAHALTLLTEDLLVALAWLLRHLHLVLLTVVVHFHLVALRSGLPAHVLFRTATYRLVSEALAAEGEGVVGVVVIVLLALLLGRFVTFVVHD